MENFNETAEFIFYNIIKYKNFKIVEKNKNSILFTNNKCFLFIGQHMGEIFVNLFKDKESIRIQPLMWAVINKGLKKEDRLPLTFSPDMKLEDFVKCNLSIEKVLISIYCTELLDGDFSKMTYYEDSFEIKSKELYNYYNERYYKRI
ncbi:hypothetical protein [Jejuia pallidilutea]|nr:hypothetical protein [Jejuia pallidilutea]